MSATNPDGTYTRDFLLWEARLAARVTGRDLIDAAPTAFVLGVADIKAQTDPVIAGPRKTHNDACAAYFVAMVDLADLDPAVDIRPLLPA